MNILMALFTFTWWGTEKLTPSAQFHSTVYYRFRNGDSLAKHVKMYSIQFIYITLFTVSHIKAF